MVLLKPYRCLAIGHSHSLLGKPKDALGIYARAAELAASVKPSGDAGGPPNLDVSSQQVQFLSSTLQGLIPKYRGIATLERLSAEETSKTSDQRRVVERLQEYAGELDLENLVPYPPQVRPIPVKPLFLDVAWNYIDYPRETARQASGEQLAGKASTRRGWFGFGL